MLFFTSLEKTNKPKHCIELIALNNAHDWTLYELFMLFVMSVEAEANRQYANEMGHCYVFPLVRIVYQVFV